MRILMLAQFYPPTIGGEERHVRNHRIRGTMQRVSVLFSEKGRRFAPPFPDIETMRALHRIVKQERPDIVHAHNWIVHSFTDRKSWSRAKLVVTLHDYSLVCTQKRLTYFNEVCDGPALAKCLRCATDFYGIAKG